MSTSPHIAIKGVNLPRRTDVFVSVAANVVLSVLRGKSGVQQRQVSRYLGGLVVNLYSPIGSNGKIEASVMAPGFTPQGVNLPDGGSNPNPRQRR